MANKMVGSCGHEITIFDWQSRSDPTITIMAFTENFDEDCLSRCLEIISPCSDCRDWYYKNGLVLDTQEKERLWLSGKTKYPNVYD